jgi:hypothetical protein
VEGLPFRQAIASPQVTSTPVLSKGMVAMLPSTRPMISKSPQLMPKVELVAREALLTSPPRAFSEPLELSQKAVV